MTESENQPETRAAETDPEPATTPEPAATPEPGPQEAPAETAPETSSDTAPATTPLGRLRAVLAEGDELARRQAAHSAALAASLEELSERLGGPSCEMGDTLSWLPAQARSEVEIIDPRASTLRLAEVTHLERELRVSTRARRVALGLDVALTSAKLAAMARGATHRVLYDQAALEGPDARHQMRYWAEAGEQQRIVHELPAEFIIIGSTTVALTSERDNTFAFISEPEIVAAYTALFEFAWSAGVPDPARPETDESRRLIRLLESGYKDEAIARHLGVSLRTVRRRVAALMAEAGVSTRFQLGRTLARGGMPHGVPHA